MTETLGVGATNGLPSNGFVRPAYQRHNRNISTVSDISVATSAAPHYDPSGCSGLGRIRVTDDNPDAEIRVVLLCDSESERRALFETFAKCFHSSSTKNDGLWSNFEILHHHWEQPYPFTPNLRFVGNATAAESSSTNEVNETPLVCRLPPTINHKHHPSGQSVSSSTAPIFVKNCDPGGAEGFFRFSFNSTFFRMMLLCKDRQNLLKMYSYDFILVGLQVAKSCHVQDSSSSSSHGSRNRLLLDEDIWEFEWKRLIKYARKALSPLIVVGYLRDLSKLNPDYHTVSSHYDLKKLLNEANSQTIRLGKSHKSFARFIDFVSGDGCSHSKSTTHALSNLMSDILKLATLPGYVLDQCAHVNNSAHFSRVINSALFEESDILYMDSPSMCDNPVMIAAKLRHKDILSCALRSSLFYSNDGALAGACETYGGGGASNYDTVAFGGNGQLSVYENGGAARSSVCGRSNECVLSRFIHQRNSQQQTLLSMVAIQGAELEEQKLLILGKEIEIHCESRLTHVADQLKLQRCLRSQLKSSAEAAIILDQCRALQGIPKTEHELKMEKCKVWTRLFFSSLMLSIIFNAIDTGSDILIVIRYYSEWMGTTVAGSHYNSTCGDDDQLGGLFSSEYQPPSCMDVKSGGWSVNQALVQNTSGISIQCFPDALSPQQKFGYTLFFILIPWPFFIYEFFTSSQYQQLVARGQQIVKDFAAGCCGSSSSSSAAKHGGGRVSDGVGGPHIIDGEDEHHYNRERVGGRGGNNKDSIVWTTLKNYMRAILYTISFVSCFLLWPIAILFIKYYNDGKYYLSKGQKRAEREKKIESSEVLYSTARVMEVSLESSFQPTIQLYILFPVLFRTVTAPSFSLKIFTVCKNEFNLPMLKTDQTVSIITSILSLAWCFTAYHATLKRGALDKDLGALFYRAVLFLSVLFQIIGRLFILVLFAYSFGPGMYFPLLIFLSVHIFILTGLHFIFSDAKHYWVKGGFLNLSFFHYMIGNGLANVYIHNWIRMDPLLIQFSKPRQHVSTLVRQFTFDVIFLSENITLLFIALNSNIPELNESRIALIFVLLGFSVVGLILKAVYYRYLHIWAWLIMDYIIQKVDGHWKCVLFSNMYLCGDLKERELTLCCIPRPIMTLLNFFFGDRSFKWPSSGGGSCSCSLCGALFSILLVPLAFTLAIILFTLCILISILFLPVFAVFILPCIIFRRLSDPPSSDGDIEKCKLRYYCGGASSKQGSFSDIVLKTLTAGSSHKPNGNGLLNGGDHQTGSSELKEQLLATSTVNPVAPLEHGEAKAVVSVDAVVDKVGTESDVDSQSVKSENIDANNRLVTFKESTNKLIESTSDLNSQEEGEEKLEAMSDEIACHYSKTNNNKNELVEPTLSIVSTS